MNLQPIILDVGSRTSKEIKQLKNHKGKLLEKVEEAVRERFPLSITSDAKSTDRKVVPVVLIFRKKPKRRPITLHDVLFPLG